MPFRSSVGEILDSTGTAERAVSTPLPTRDESISLIFVFDLSSDARSASYTNTSTPFIAKRSAQLEPMMPAPTQATFFGRLVDFKTRRVLPLRLYLGVNWRDSGGGWSRGHVFFICA